MAIAQGSKPVKKTAAPKKTTKASPSHPPYIEMITEALVALKERTGSSHYAIAKHIEEQQKVRDLPPNFKKLLSVQLKKFVASGKLVKVKNSFKLPPTVAKKSPSPAPAAESKPKPKAKEVPAKKKESAKSKAVAAAPAKAKKTEKTTVKAKAPVKKVTAAAAKKVVPAKAKKPKSIKSPAKKTKSIKSPAKKAKAPAAKKARK